MNYLFPVKDGIISTGFWELRPYSKPVKERTYIHRAWDIAPYSMDYQHREIVAPTDGKLFFHCFFRYPSTKKPVPVDWTDISKMYTFYHWYYDTMGAVSILIEEGTGFVFAFAHQDVFEWSQVVLDHHSSIIWRDLRVGYNDYIRYALTDGIYVRKGKRIGVIGCAGFATGYHTHMQIHAGRDYLKRIDPAYFWDNKLIHDNGDAPRYGVCKSAPFIPPMNMIHCK